MSFLTLGFMNFGLVLMDTLAACCGQLVTKGHVKSTKSMLQIGRTRQPRKYPWRMDVPKPPIQIGLVMTCGKVVTRVLPR
jgi:hypothetical protein